MIQIIKELNIEVSKPNVFQAVVAKQYDMNTRFIKATFVDYGEKITIPQSATLKVVINALRNDGLSKGFEGEINADGTVTVPLHSWMLELVGTVVCDISVIDTAEDDEKKLTTTSFTLIVEKASWGGDDIASDPQGDVLIDLLNRVETAGEMAEEALQKSTEANAVYDRMVEVTRESEAIVNEWQNEIDKTNARLDEMVVARSLATSDPYAYEDDHFNVEITTNGAIAYIWVKLTDIVPDGVEITRTFPSMFMPFDEQVVFEHQFGEAFSIAIYPDQDGEYTILAVKNSSDSTINASLSATYDLASVMVHEIADMRVGYDGTVFPTAGDAVRAAQQTAADVVDLANSMNEDVADHGRRIKKLEDGGPLDVHEVEDYAFAVADEDGNVAFGIKPDGETVGTFPDNVARAKLAPITSTKDYAYAVCDEGGQVVFAITHDGEVKYIGAGSGASGGGSTFDLTKCGLPILYLEGDTSGMSKEKEDAKELAYTFGANTGTCKVRWQGSSSVSRGYPKRNYTIEFDTEFEATEVWGHDGERVVNFAKPWGAQKKYCAKANWIDPSGARNVVCARLWAAIVADRATRYGTVPEKLVNAPNYGAIDGFPIIIVINDEFTGLYTFNIPKEDWMFNMGDGAAEYVVACESNETMLASCRWSGPATFEDEEDYAIEVIPDGVEDSVLIGSFNTAINEMVNATQSAEWENDVAPYFDVDAAIDYMIFVCCIGGRDNLRKNVLYGTYDGIKWFMSAYDLDTTFGANVHNKGWYPVINDRNQFYEASTMHRVFSYIYKFSKERLKTRYAELRSSVLSDENVWYMLNNFVSNIPLTVYNMDAERWSDKLDNAPGRKTAMQSTAAANVNNYMHYYRMHCAYLDKEIEAL